MIRYLAFANLATAGRIRAALLGTLMVAMAVAASAQNISGSATAYPRPPAPLVTVVAAKVAPLVNRVPVSATLVARNEILIYPQISGFRILSMQVNVGDKVKRGDLLAQIDGQTLSNRLVQAGAEYARTEASIRQAQSQISSANASLDQANAAHKRALRLSEQGNVSQATLDSAVTGALTAKAAFNAANAGLALARAALRQAGAQRDLARLNLSRTQVRAPVDGLISQRNGKVGAIATAAGAPIFRLIKNGVIEAKANLIETALGRVKTDDLVELALAGLGPVNGRIRLIYPTVDPATRLGTIRISLDAAKGLRTGLYAGGWIIIERHRGLTVPASAVLGDVTGSYVLKLKGDTLYKTPVVAGIIWKGQREVLKGLVAGDKVVATASAFFGNGDVIRPINPEGQAVAITGAKTDASQ